MNPAITRYGSMAVGGLGFLVLMVWLLGTFKLSTLGFQLFTGLITSTILILISSGLTFVAGILHVINISHAILYTLGAFFGVVIFQWVRAFGNVCMGDFCIDPFWFSLIGAPIGVGIVGALLERFTISRIYSRDPIYGLLLTLGLTLILTRVVEIIWGHDPLPFDSPAFTKGLVNLGFMYYPTYRLFVLIAGALVVFLTWMFLRMTNFGLIMRAGVYDPQIVGAMGINLKKAFTKVFAFGAVLAAIAGVIVSPMRAVEPEMGNLIIIDAFIVLVIGGMGSFRGAVVGALVLGMSQSLGALIGEELGIRWLTEILVYLVMALVLLVRPQGLFGQAQLH